MRGSSQFPGSITTSSEEGENRQWAKLFKMLFFV
jgi:hypothetical protein